MTRTTSLTALAVGAALSVHAMAQTVLPNVIALTPE
jgi:hypothetical protein